MTPAPLPPDFLPLHVGRPCDATPPGWAWRRLTDVARLESGHTPSRLRPEWWGGDVPWISLSDIRELDAKVAYDTREHTNAGGIANSAARILPPGTVVLSRTASVGFVTIMGREMATSQDFVNWVCGPDLEPRFLAMVFRTARDFIRLLASGATHKTVYMPTVEAFSVCIPPLREQRRIADWIESCLAPAARARAAAEVQVGAADQLAAAYLDDVFGKGRIADAPVLPLGECGAIVSGVTLGRQLPSEPTRLVPYLRVANVKDGYLDLSVVRSIEVSGSELQKWRLKRGDLLLTEGGDRDKLGRGTVWDDQIPGCIHQNHIFRVRLDREQVLPEFVAAQIGSPYGKAYFLRHAKQTTGIATINQLVLSAFPLRRPSLDEQGRIMVSLRARRAAVESLRERLSAQLAEIRAFPAALLRRAFSGSFERALAMALGPLKESSMSSRVIIDTWQDRK